MLGGDGAFGGARHPHRALRLSARAAANPFTLAFWLGILGAGFGQTDWSPALRP